jgi:hypothetical protein
MRSAKAISISQDGTAIAILGKNYEVSKISLVTLNGKLTIDETNIGRIPEEEEGEQDTWSTVGFLNGVADPVVSRGRILYVLREGKYEKISLVDLVPGLFTTTMIWPEIAGGVLRLQARDRGQGKLRFSNVMYAVETGQFKATPVQELAVRVGPWPTFSDFSSKYIRSIPNPANPRTAFLVVGSREDPANEQRIANVSMEDTSSGQQAQLEAAPGFLRSLAFSDGDEAVAVRDSQSTFRIITGLWSTPREGSSEFTVKIPNVIQATPVRSGWSIARPTLAVTKTPSTWRLGWLTTQGIMVLDADADSNGLGKPRWPPLTPSARDLEAVTKLRFSGDGRVLITLEPKWQQSTKLRIYDLSDERRDFIRRLSDDGLVAEACRIAQEHEDSNQFTSAEMNAWPLIGASQPCER